MVRKIAPKARVVFVGFEAVLSFTIDPRNVVADCEVRRLAGPKLLFLPTGGPDGRVGNQA